MSTTLRSTEKGNSSQTSDVIVLDEPASESASPAAADTSLRRESRTVNACEQCQRRKTKCKCTGQPSPCEACEKTGLSCHFDSKINWKTRSRATYSAEDGRLQYMLNAVLSVLKYSDEKVLNELIVALRQNESPETIAMHLGNNMEILREHGRIPNMAIDQEDLMSLASRISGPAISNVPHSDTDSSIEMQSHHMSTIGLGVSGSEYDSQMLDDEHWQQVNPIDPGLYQSPLDSGWSPVYTLSPNPGQGISHTPWSPTHFTPTQALQQPYHGSQGPNVLQNSNTVSPNSMYQSHHVDPYSGLQPSSGSNQFYPPQQGPMLYRSSEGFNESRQRSNETTPGYLSIVHEGVASEFNPHSPMAQPQQQRTSHRNQQLSYPQNVSSTANQQKRKGNANVDQRSDKDDNNP